MANSRKKHEILGGVKVSSGQLSEWGKIGGRPQKYSNPAERARAFRLRKKQEKLGEKAKLRGYKSYGEVQIQKTAITCPHCHWTITDKWSLRQYFNEKGEYIPEIFWVTPRGEKYNIHENKFRCHRCYWSFSFKEGEIVAKEVREIKQKSGSILDRVRRFREKRKKAPSGLY